MKRVNWISQLVFKLSLQTDVSLIPHHRSLLQRELIILQFRLGLKVH